MSPKISVLMPAYNAENYIAEAIESILSQTFKDFEFIIIDNCSTDQSWWIIQEYAKVDQRIVALKNESNLGIAGNRNKLITFVRGDYVAWQDADDISMPYRLEKQYQWMVKNPEVGILGGWLQFFNKRGDLSIRKYAMDDKSLREAIFKYSPVAQPAAMIRRSCLDEIGPYELRYPLIEDLDMSFRIGTKYRFANLPEIVLRYREHSLSATFTRLKKIELNTLKIRRKYSSGYGYTMTLMDKVYNFLQHISIYIIPARMKVWLFNLFRNSR